ncbi:MAG: glycosyltransferase family 4 protein [bacterium]|nr:glycosyltransferase family 4 protein [bacterium]
MEKPKVIIFTTAYFPFIGGAEIAIQEITKRLKDRFDFYIITSRLRRDLPPKEVRPEGTIVRIGFGTRFDKWLLPFAPLYYKNSASIMLGVDISQGSLAAAFYKLLHPKCKFVFNIQYGYGEERLRKGRLGMLALAFRIILRQADCVTAISKHLSDVAREYNYKRSMEVIPNGVDFNRFQNPNYKLQINSNPPTGGPNPKIIITTSRLVQKNGIDILIKAIAEIKKEISDVQCWIIGDGPERKALELQATSYKLQANIKFFGEIPHEKIPEHLHQADIFVRPSRSEGMGNSFVEALSAGLPIIGTPVGGITDIIKDTKTGLFARAGDSSDLAQKIKLLLANEELRQTIVKNGYQLIKEHFAWEKISGGYGIIFDELQTKEKLCLVIATGLFPPDIGGPATYSKTLSEELPKRGFDVKVVSFGLVRHLPKFIRHLAYFLKICRAAWKSDIIFAQDPVSVGLPAMLAAKILRKKFILKIVGDYAWEQHQTTNTKVMSLEEFQEKKLDFITELRRWIEFLVARQAKIIITPSNYLKKIVSGWGIKENIIKVIYNSFDIPQVVESREEARKKLNLSGFVIISAGRLVPWKGFETVMDVIPEVLREIPQLKLIIVGSGPDEKKLEERIKELKLEKIITMVGRISHDQLLTYLRGGDVFLLNTAYEGFSHTILEAMAVEIPVITTRVGGNPEVITDGLSGLLIEYNEKEGMRTAILRIYNNPELRLRVSQHALLKAREFNQDRMLSQVASVLQQL